LIYNYIFNKQKDRLNILYVNSITKNSLLILTFIASFIRLVYPILLVTTIMQTISFSGFSNDFALKKGGEVSEKGRFEIQNFSLNSKRQKVVLQSLNETEQLLNDYSKANYFVDANILDKISITFFV